MKFLLELAKDVGVLCRDAGGLQDRHPEGKNISNPEVIQSRVQLAVQTGFQRTVLGVCTGWEEGDTAQVRAPTHVYC